MKTIYRSSFSNGTSTSMMKMTMMIGVLTSLLLAIPTVRIVDAMKPNAIVVGAGPAGLASALVLARRHGYQVTIIESSDRTDVFDPTKAYPFLVRERGQKLTKLFPKLQQRLEENGIAVEGPTEIVSVPANPKDILDVEPKPVKIFIPKGRNFWIRRHDFIRILLDTVAEEEDITVLNNVQCELVAPLMMDGSNRIQVVVADRRKVGKDGTSIGTSGDDGKRTIMETSLVIGSDGMKSMVRQSLTFDAKSAPSPSSSIQTFADRSWENSDPRGFRIKSWLSPASGLKFKTLQINADAKVPVGDGTMYDIPFGVQTFHAIRSIHTSPTKQVSLGLLPSRAAPTRTLNVIRYGDHEIWKVKDGNELREWFAEAFPRFDFSSNSSLVDQAEFDRFAQSPGLYLPPCQYSPELYVSSPSGDSAIVLVGDAVHCFPPDLGEGVNSGLEDVVALDQALSENDTIGAVARAYAKERGPEAKALVRMVRFGSPFQYGQFGGIITVKRFLWTFNFFGRMLLNKLTFGLTPQPVSVQVSDGQERYSTIMRRGDTLTVSLWAITSMIFLRLTGLVPKLRSLLLA